VSRRVRRTAQNWARRPTRNLGNLTNVMASGDNVQSGFKRKGKNVSSSAKGRKKIKVSPKFTKSVKQVLEKTSPKGFNSEKYMIRYTPTDDTQAVVDLGGGWDNVTAPNTTDGGRLHFFDPIRVLDAASVLFNGKAFNGAKSGANTGQFDAKTTTVDVVKQWVDFEIKNNTARRITIKLWSWQYKGNLRGTADFTGYWDAALNEEGAAADGRLNCYGVTKTMIGVSPKLSPRMRDMYKIEEKVINLEAGKTCYHSLQGYRGIYDFSKFWDGVNFNNYTKHNMGVCMAFYVDVVATTTGGNSTATRSTDLTLASPFGLLVETTTNYVIRMPEQAGFQITAAAAGTYQTLKDRRQYPYAIKFNVGPTGVIGSVNEIDDENPQNAASVGV